MRLKSDIFILLALLGTAFFLAHANHFMEDDAYISFTYARNFAQGHGLVWYPGLKEYGYTNFLHTLLVGIGMAVGFSAETASYILTLPALAGAIVLTYALCLRLQGSRMAATAAALGLATHLSFTSFATSGLETIPQAFWIVAVYYTLAGWFEHPARRSLLLMALFSSAALLTRLDSALLLFPAYAALGLRLLRDMQKSGARRAPLFSLAMVTLPPCAAVLGLLLFAQLYYGQSFPTSAMLKLDSSWHSEEGFMYLAFYNRAQMHMPALLLLFAVLAFLVYQGAGKRLLTGLLAAPVAIWCIYILHVGGDFMEFRFLLPALPLFYAFVALAITNISRREYWLAPVTGLLFVVSNYAHYNHFDRTGLLFYPLEKPRLLVESTVRADFRLNGGPVGWVDIGKTFHTLFYTGSADDVSIAIRPAGAIAYYSGLPSLDQHGLNSRIVLEKYATPFLEFVGHRIISSPQSYGELGINLVIGEPIYLRKKRDLFVCIRALGTYVHQRLENARVLFIPVKESFYVYAEYVTPHPKIEALIEDGTIIAHASVASRTRCLHGFSAPEGAKLKKPSFLF